jgi:lipid-A-disaccharide synthase-like uncharacterized protein
MHPSWLALGLVGQAAFASRFLAQWIASERAGRSVMPGYFWFASIVGAVILLAYAIHLKDPVFILGQSAGMLIYARNISLRRNEGRTRQEHA